MAPAHAPAPARRALLWSTLPALAALLGLLWLRRRRAPRLPRRKASLSAAASPSATVAAAAAQPCPDALASDSARPPSPVQVKEASVTEAQPPSAATPPSEPVSTPSPSPSPSPVVEPVTAPASESSTDTSRASREDVGTAQPELPPWKHAPLPSKEGLLVALEPPLRQRSTPLVEDCTSASPVDLQGGTCRSLNIDGDSSKKAVSAGSLERAAIKKNKPEQPLEVYERFETSRKSECAKNEVEKESLSKSGEDICFNDTANIEEPCQVSIVVPLKSSREFQGEDTREEKEIQTVLSNENKSKTEESRPLSSIAAEYLAVDESKGLESLQRTVKADLESVWLKGDPVILSVSEEPLSKDLSSEVLDFEVLKDTKLTIESRDFKIAIHSNPEEILLNKVTQPQEFYQCNLLNTEGEIPHLSNSKTVQVDEMKVKNSVTEMNQVNHSQADCEVPYSENSNKTVTMVSKEEKSVEPAEEVCVADKTLVPSSKECEHSNKSNQVSESSKKNPNPKCREICEVSAKVKESSEEKNKSVPNKPSRKSKANKTSPKPTSEVVSKTTEESTINKNESLVNSVSSEQQIVNSVDESKGDSQKRNSTKIKDASPEKAVTVHSKESVREGRSSSATPKSRKNEKRASRSRSKPKETENKSISPASDTASAVPETVIVTVDAKESEPEPEPEQLTREKAQELAMLIQQQFAEAGSAEPKKETITSDASERVAEAATVADSNSAVVAPEDALESEGRRARSAGDSEEESALSPQRECPRSEAIQHRDSANHSPAEGMLASPRAACYSEDAASEDSSDSGKGCSDVPTPPSRTPASGSSVSGDGAASASTAAASAAAAANARVYEFVLPQHLVGRLIGRHGCFVHQIKSRTNASILIKRHPDTERLKICAVEGSVADVDSALEMIREKFPEKRYPQVTLEQVCFVAPPPPVVPVLPDCLRLQLIEGVTNDVVVSSLVTPAHFFLQQPTHPTFPALAQLGAFMDATYGENDTPPVPVVQGGIVVAAPVLGSWYRAEVVGVESEVDTCCVRYVDYGGYEVQSNSALRQIRSDFMTLPFQAAECYLANVICKNEEEGWSPEALTFMEQMTAGQVLQAQVCGYYEDGLPAVALYAIVGSRVVSIGDELVARGFAQWWENADG